MLEIQGRVFKVAHNLSFLALVAHKHCVKSVQIRSFFWSVFSHIRTEYLSVFIPNAGKYGPEKTLYLDIFHAVKPLLITLFINITVAQKLVTHVTHRSFTFLDDTQNIKLRTLSRGCFVKSDLIQMLQQMFLTLYCIMSQNGQAHF